MLAGVFLIPYFFMLFFCGLPLFLMEMVIGQYSGSGPANVFEAAPIFKGMAHIFTAKAQINFRLKLLQVLGYMFAIGLKNLKMP